MILTSGAGRTPFPARRLSAILFPRKWGNSVFCLPQSFYNNLLSTEFQYNTHPFNPIITPTNVHFISNCLNNKMLKNAIFSAIPCHSSPSNPFKFLLSSSAPPLPHPHSNGTAPPPSFVATTKPNRRNDGTSTKKERRQDEVAARGPCVFLKSLDRFLLVKLIGLSNKSAAVLNRLTEGTTMDNAEPSLTVWRCKVTTIISIVGIFFFSP